MASSLSTYEVPNIENNTIRIRKISTMRTEISRRIIKKLEHKNGHGLK